MPDGPIFENVAERASTSMSSIPSISIACVIVSRRLVPRTTAETSRCSDVHAFRGLALGERPSTA